jgi:hypothetical protein
MAAYYFTTASGGLAGLVLAGLVFAAGLVLRHPGYLRVERAADLLEERRRNLGLRKGIRGIGNQLRQAAQVVDVWESVKAATPVLGADTVTLRFVERSRPGSHCAAMCAMRRAGRQPRHGRRPGRGGRAMAPARVANARR